MKKTIIIQKGNLVKIGDRFLQKGEEIKNWKFFKRANKNALLSQGIVKEVKLKEKNRTKIKSKEDDIKKEGG